jgi:hypothetical protein
MAVVYSNYLLMLWFPAPVISQGITDRNQCDSCPIINAPVRLVSDRTRQTNKYSTKKWKKQIQENIVARICDDYIRRVLD